MLGINWKKIDNGVTFHSFVNQLFLSEYGFRYTPGRPRGGADGGWDGCTIEAKALRLGIDSARPAMIQAKHTWLAGTQAVSQLKRDLLGRPTKKGELEKARDAGVDLLVLVTPAALDVGDIQQLEGVPSADGPRVVVLAQEHLEHLLSRHRWLLRDFFGLPIGAALIPIDRVPDPVQSLGLKPLPWVGRESLTAEVLALVRERSVVTVVAGGGEGKSRFVRELARELGRTYDGLIRYNSKSLTAESIIQNEILDPEREYVILIDDAERTYERDVRAFAREIAAGRKLRLLLTARAGAHETLGRELMTDGVSPSTLELPHVDKSERQRLIASELGVDDVDAELIDRRCDGNFFIISCLATSRADAAFRQDDVKKYVNYRIREQARQTLNELGLSFHRDLLPLLASMAGTEHRDEMLGEIAIHLSVDGNLISHLRVLQAAGVLRDVGESCRFEVDMVGDIVLELAMSEAHAGDLADFVFAKMLPFDENCIFRNLAPAAATPEISKRLDWLFNEWVKDIRRGDLDSAPKRVDFLSYFANTLPDACERFVRAAIEVCERTPTLQSKQRMLDMLAPLVKRLGLHVALAPAMLDALDRLALLQSVPAQTHHSVGQVVAVWCNAADLGSFDLPIAVLGQVEQWSASAALTPPRLAMSLSAISMCLAGALPRERSFPDKYVLGIQHLIPTEAAERVRDVAVKLLVRLIEHDHADTRIGAIRTIGDIGKTKGLGDGASPFLKHAVVETEQCLRAVQTVVAGDSRLRVQVTAWVAVLHEWLCSPEQEALAASILSAMRWTIELQTCLAWWFPHDTVDSFASLQTRAPRDGRWAWWCHEESRWPTAGDPVSASDLRLARDVASQFSTSDSLAAFFSNIADGALPDVRERWHLPGWLLALASSHPELLEEVLHHPEKATIPTDVLGAVETAWLRNAPDAPAKVLAKVQGEERRLDVGVALQLTYLARIGRVAPSHLIGLAWHDDNRVQDSVLGALLFARTLSSDDLGVVLATLVKRGTEARLQAILHQIRYLLHGRLESPVNRGPVREACLGRLGTEAASEDVLAALHRLLAWSSGGSVSEYVAACDEVLAQGVPVNTAALLSPLDRNDGDVQLPVKVGDVSIFLAAWGRWLAAGQVDRSYQWRMLRSMGRSAEAITGYVEAELAGDTPKLAHLKELLEAQDFERCAAVWLKLASRAATSPVPESPDILGQFEGAAGFVREWSSTGDEEPAAFGMRINLLTRLSEQTSVPEVQYALANGISAVDAQRRGWSSRRQERRDRGRY